MTREEAREALSVLKIYDALWLREAVDMAIEALSAEAVQGEWIDAKMDYGECSECGFYGFITDYCPNCGARMMGDDE